MNDFDKEYRRLVRDVLGRGTLVQGRNAQTYELFGRSVRFNLRQGFPLLTGRKLYPRGVFGELAAFLKGADQVTQFEAEGCNYWSRFGYGDTGNELGPIYGVQWRYWNGYYDQISALIQDIKNNPQSRRHIVTCWAPQDLDAMALPPCYPTFQVRVHPAGFLDLMVNQRSCDVMVGLPSDIILFSTLMHLLCVDTSLMPGELVFSIGSAHIYLEHVDNAHVYLNRPTSDEYPQLFCRGMGCNDFNPKDVTWENDHVAEPLAFELIL